LEFWGRAFRWVSGTGGVQLKFRGKAFRCVFRAGYLIEVLGQTVQVGQYIQLRFWAEPSGGL
jgi:hypothetical protein